MGAVASPASRHAGRTRNVHNATDISLVDTDAVGIYDAAMPTPPGLSIEFAAAQTIAVITRGDGGIEPLPIDGSPQLPAPRPGEAGALLGRIRVAASAALGELPRTVTLAHPDDWGAARLQELVDAVRYAGLPDPTLLPRLPAVTETPTLVSAMPPVPDPGQPQFVPGPPPPGPATGARAVLVVVAAVVALLLGIGVGGAVGYGIGSGREPAESEVGEDETQAVKAAEAGAAAMLSYDSANLDESMDDAKSHMTASFAKEYQENMEGLRKTIEAEDAEVKSEVIDSGVAETKNGAIEVLMFVDQTIKNKNIESERVDHSRVVATMVAGEDGWKIDDVKSK